MTWVTKTAMAGCTWTAAIVLGIVLLIWVGAEEAWKAAVRRQRERRLARQVDRERASW